MNEELEQRGRSSGLGQRKDDKQGNRLNFGAVDELNSFLIRRQLLTMESKRIQTVLADTEAEVKVRQGDLVYLRDGVLTALREHLGRQEEVARVESLNRQKLENLPRNAERYLRRRVKKLLAHLKPRFGGSCRPIRGGSRPGRWLASAQSATTNGLDGMVCRVRASLS